MLTILNNLIKDVLCVNKLFRLTFVIIKSKNFCLFETKQFYLCLNHIYKYVYVFN